MSHGFAEKSAGAIEADRSGTTSLAQLPSVLEKIAEQEEPFTERFYEIFFELRPDSLPLFGVHSISEREEMMRETKETDEII